jgi:hypothetical protein
VNYFYFEICNREKGKITYKNSWIADKVITQENVTLLTECARARWKIENENNNMLKNYGYRLEHNFEHGENRAGEVYRVLNLPAFPVHGLMILWDETFIKVRSYFGWRDEFYNALKTFFRAFEFQSGEIFCFLLSITPEAAESKIAVSPPVNRG